MDGSRLRSRLANLQKVTVISTMNTPPDIYRDMFNNVIEGSLIKGTFRQIGIENVEWISLNMVKQVGNEKRSDWLRAIEEAFAK
ncbi:MAG: hypothetical protein IJ394_09690 [Bacteroidales bacterium]|nr:hypothetical protein [Bacteroidales bacterium]